MKTSFYVGLLCLSLAMPVAAGEPHTKDRYRIVVAADGTGDFASVQQAIDHVPEYNLNRFVIAIEALSN